MDIQIFGASAWAQRAAACVSDGFGSLNITFAHTAALLASYGVVGVSGAPIGAACVAAANRSANASLLSPCGATLCAPLPAPPLPAPAAGAGAASRPAWVYAVAAVAGLLLLLALAVLLRKVAFRRALSSSGDDAGKYTVGFIPEADEEVKMAVRQRNAVDAELDEIDLYGGGPATLSEMLRPHPSPRNDDECGTAHSSISI